MSRRIRKSEMSSPALDLLRAYEIKDRRYQYTILAAVTAPNLNLGAKADYIYDALLDRGVYTTPQGYELSYNAIYQVVRYLAA